jgi:hypothetical protein
MASPLPLLRAGLYTIHQAFAPDHQTFCIPYKGFVLNLATSNVCSSFRMQSGLPAI